MYVARSEGRVPLGGLFLREYLEGTLTCNNNPPQPLIGIDSDVQRGVLVPALLARLRLCVAQMATACDTLARTREREREKER